MSDRLMSLRGIFFGAFFRTMNFINDKVLRYLTQCYLTYNKRCWVFNCSKCSKCAIVRCTKKTLISSRHHRIDVHSVCTSRSQGIKFCKVPLKGSSTSLGCGARNGSSSRRGQPEVPPEWTTQLNNYNFIQFF
jgi:hypothetical protein